MMTLKRITDSHSTEVGRLAALLRETFPEYERYQDTTLLRNMIDHEKDLFFNAVYEDGELAGFFMYWDLSTCCYVHFIAIFPSMRNRKTGQGILQWISENLSLPVFLEAEIPYDDLSARRLNFYKRNGFSTLAENPEILAADRDGGHPLWFMGNRPVEELESCLIRIRERVYHATGE